MLIGLDEKEKTLDEGLGFSKENLFEYLAYILCHRNANWFGEKADGLIKEINTCLESIASTSDALLEINDLMIDALTAASQQAYESGFREACRLRRTLDSF